ncbi:hypothetical protein CHU95_05505 [Niveispirillum lacus]|uniref:Type II secretion system protein GspE N-terminal domain-containing protein n=1 Tax=Niveispirillum lacus TaxID=1981099 RepID=A0A255Z5T3_9PROT|nr:hypothetical protein [Niveispirillum lacus]OYQ36245.1 hypothetical protein CHU95_05505 [Niveispirillum lacus]
MAIPLWRPDVLPDPVPLLDTPSPAWLRAMGLLPLERTPEGGIIAAMADPLDTETLRGLEFVTEGGPVHPHAQHWKQPSRGTNKAHCHPCLRRSHVRVYRPLGSAGY